MPHVFWRGTMHHWDTPRRHVGSQAPSPHQIMHGASLDANRKCPSCNWIHCRFEHCTHFNTSHTCWTSQRRLQTFSHYLSIYDPLQQTPILHWFALARTKFMALPSHNSTIMARKLQSTSKYKHWPVAAVNCRHREQALQQHRPDQVRRTIKTTDSLAHGYKERREEWSFSPTGHDISLVATQLAIRVLPRADSSTQRVFNLGTTLRFRHCHITTTDVPLALPPPCMVTTWAVLIYYAKMAVAVARP